MPMLQVMYHIWISCTYPCLSKVITFFGYKWYFHGENSILISTFITFCVFADKIGNIYFRNYTMLCSPIIKKRTTFAIMDIIEQYSIGKRKDCPCEDGWIVTHDFAAVVDGSTAKIKIAKGQESPGHLAMRLVCNAIGTLPAEATKEEALTWLTRAIAADTTYAAINYRPTCSAVIYSRFHHEVWFVGDCQARWHDKTYHFEKKVDTILTDIRCQAIRYYLNHGYTEENIRQNDKGRAFIYDALCDQLHFQNDPNPNNPYSYPVIDGQHIRPDLIPAIPVDNANELILASDGYPQLCNTLEHTEEKLAEVLRIDPLCIRENPSSKCLVEGNRSFDDRTYLRILI